MYPEGHDIFHNLYPERHDMRDFRQMKGAYPGARRIVPLGTEDYVT